MIDPKDITICGVTYTIPDLPFRVTRIVLPLCVKLTLSGIADRHRAMLTAMVDAMVDQKTTEATGLMEVTTEELDDLSEIAFRCVAHVDATMTRPAWDDLPLLSAELLSAFFVIRYQTGNWIPATPNAPVETAEGQQPAGEAQPTAKKRRRR